MSKTIRMVAVLALACTLTAVGGAAAVSTARGEPSYLHRDRHPG
jgi:hypothetical protein